MDKKPRQTDGKAVVHSIDFFIFRSIGKLKLLASEDLNVRIDTRISLLKMRLAELKKIK